MTKGKDAQSKLKAEPEHAQRGAESSMCLIGVDALSSFEDAGPAFIHLLYG